MAGACDLDRDPWSGIPARGGNVSESALNEAFDELIQAGEPYSGIPAMQLYAVTQEQAAEMLEVLLTQDHMHELAGNHEEEEEEEAEEEDRNMGQ